MSTREEQMGLGLRKRTRKSFPEYSIWKGMRQRCRRQASKSYLGVSVCDRWMHSFQAFLEDMGPRPTLRHTIDRKNNALGYEPGNCRWATYTEQNRNKSSNVWVTLDGRTQLIVDWALELGIQDRTIRFRLKSGWTPEEALRTPVGVEPPGRPHSKSRAKLTPDQVCEIRRRRADGEPYDSLATAFGVVPGTIGFIVRGETWREAHS